MVLGDSMISAKKMTELMKDNSFDALMNSEIIAVEAGKTQLKFTSRKDQHGNRRGDVHGGVLIAISDSSMGSACFSLGKAVSTLDLNGNYLRPVSLGETVIFHSEIEHNGQRTIVATCKAYNSEGKQVYTGRGTFFVLGVFEKALMEE